MTRNDAFTLEEIQTYPRTHRFLVFAETKPGCWYNIKSTNNRKSATDTANFWDERVNVMFIDAVEEQMQKEWAEQREAERIASLPIHEQLDIALQNQINRINQQAEEIIASM